MAHDVEILNRFTEYRDCGEYVYSHVSVPCEMKTSRLYRIEGEGSPASLDRLVEEVLVDPVSETWVRREEEAKDPGAHGASGCLDVFLKPGVLDLEKQYLLEYFEEGSPGDFRVEDLRITERYYLRVESDFEAVLDTVVGDLVNPVIHDWGVVRFENNGVR